MKTRQCNENSDSEIKDNITRKYGKNVESKCIKKSKNLKEKRKTKETMSRKGFKISQDSLGSLSLIIKKRETGIKQDINSSNILKEEKLLETHVLKDSSET